MEECGVDVNTIRYQPLLHESRMVYTRTAEDPSLPARRPMRVLLHDEEERRQDSMVAMLGELVRCTEHLELRSAPSTQSQEVSQQTESISQGTAEAAALQLAAANNEIFTLQARLAQSEEDMNSLRTERAEFQERFNQMTLEYCKLSEPGSGDFNQSPQKAMEVECTGLDAGGTVATTDPATGTIPPGLPDENETWARQMENQDRMIGPERCLTMLTQMTTQVLFPGRRGSPAPGDDEDVVADDVEDGPAVPVSKEEEEALLKESADDLVVGQGMPEPLAPPVLDSPSIDQSVERVSSTVGTEGKVDSVPPWVKDEQESVSESQRDSAFSSLQQRAVDVPLSSGEEDGGEPSVVRKGEEDDESKGDKLD